MQRIDITLPAEQRARLTAVWHQGRLVLGGIFVVCGGVFGLAWQWTGGLLVSTLALVSIADAVLRLRRRSFGSATTSTLVDVTVIHVGMALAGVTDSAVGIPFTYVVLSAVLLLTRTAAAVSIAYGAAWFVTVVRDWLPAQGDLSPVQVTIVAIVTDLAFAAAFVGMITVVLRIISHDRERRVQRSRIQEAVATASRALLAGNGQDALEEAIQALLNATDATAVFIEKNVEHPLHGLCSSMILEVRREGVEADPDELWTLVPWSSLTGREELEAGFSHRLTSSELQGGEAEIYEGTDIRSELDIPVFVAGRWWGLIGFTDVYQERAWSDRDEELLFTAAHLIGAHIERAEAREELDQIIFDLDQQVRYQHALAESAAALLASGATRSVDTALSALVHATDADYVYIDVNHEDPDLGLCARVVHDAESPDHPRTEADGTWWGGPYSELPTSYAALSAGRPVQILTSQLTGREREIYEDDGIKSELCIPIDVAGEWRGSIAFADYANERSWNTLEVRALRTAAVMIGTFWERNDARTRLETLVGSQERRLRYEQALSSCSQALLASGDDAALDQAIGHLLDATGADNVFVDVNEIDPDLGLVARVTHEAIAPGREEVVDEEIWIDEDTGEQVHSCIPYESLPSLRASLERGLPAVVVPRLLPPEERAAYGEAGCKTELNIPILTGGAWVGAIGLSDFNNERTWNGDEIVLLQTVAEMIGAFWERNEAHARLEEMVHSKDEFVAAVSHELRTPLTSVVGLAEELRDRRLDFTEDEVTAFIAMIAEQSTEVASIVNDLLVAARSDTGTLIIDTQPVDVREAFETVMRSEIGSGFESVEFSGSDVKVGADPTRLRQIIRNLVVNANRYGGSNLRVSVVATGEVATISIADDGPGISDDDAQSIFEPYGRAHHSSTQPASVGLGLAVARQLARLMDGDLGYQRSSGWTVFSIVLPLVSDTARSAAD